MRCLQETYNDAPFNQVIKAHFGDYQYNIVFSIDTRKILSVYQIVILFERST